MVNTEAEVVDLRPNLHLPYPLFLLRRHRVSLARQDGLLRVWNGLGGVTMLRFGRVELCTRRFRRK